MKYALRLAILLALLWLLLSGYYHPLMLSFGAFSVIFVVWLTTRMDEVDKDRFTLFVTGDFVIFIFKLLKRVVTSNIDVTLRILGVKPLHSKFIELEMPFDDELSKVLYANAITLTPGTSSISMEGGKLLVHTLSEEGAKDLEEGDMLGIMPRTSEYRKAMKQAGETKA
ncbi:Na+/H+ antiporter subunit E [Alteromonas facilis]|uniref:Na+/H+ antiporter subunit E n=1 Tax=Alteromonas facilis TaxID=2048004 RepID=UPI0013DBD7D9|nr:Na+/H+ antiporter subunit E [Alteromonas facilis]